MARCNDCNKFVSYGDADVDEIEVEIDGDTATLSGSLYLTCESCGSQIASAEMEDETDLVGIFPDVLDPDESRGESVEYEIGDIDMEPTDRSEDKDRHGKQIKNPRYMRRYYGVEVSATVTRRIVDKEGNPVGESCEAEISLSAEQQASGFESIC